MSEPSIGRSHPLGASPAPGGVNFSVYSRAASSVDLLLFDREDDASPSRIIPLPSESNRTYYYWHVFVPGVKPGQLYAWRMNDPSRFLLDPYGRAVAGMKSVVVDISAYDWEGDEPLLRPSSQTVIYEMHVRGFTRHPNSGVCEAKRGTYAGLVDKIPYLQDLGITAVELLPVFEFDRLDAPAGRVNYWGYAPVSFFAPHRMYSSRRDPLGVVDEFRDMVKALHRAGIEVILDVVYNHTAEGGLDGPTFCFKGIDKQAYYILEPDGAHFANYSGTGNSLNANHPIVRRMILDSLRYWAGEMHVDGFRFDLASILARDQTGQVMANPPVLWDIETDPELAGVKIIAEAWDAAGLYQVGAFVGESWKEWNGRFRDDVRDFLRGADHSVTRVADRMLGSPEIYGHEECEPEQSVNFATCHDGFTLNDLVSYDCKHNHENGEENRDGMNDNRSWNCGVEGPSDDPAVEALRNRQVKNFLVLTLLSLGVPMILMGDEVRRTQRGNNNAYCQDNETSWFDWSLLDRHSDIRRFVKLLIERRLRRDSKRVSLNLWLRRAQCAFHGVKLHQPDWSPHSHSLAISLQLAAGDLRMCFILNAYWAGLEFELPPSDQPWRRWIDTSLACPEDIVPWRESPPVEARTYSAGPRSVVALFSKQKRNNYA